MCVCCWVAIEIYQLFFVKETNLLKKNYISGRSYRCRRRCRRGRRLRVRVGLRQLVTLVTRLRPRRNHLRHRHRRGVQVHWQTRSIDTEGRTRVITNMGVHFLNIFFLQITRNNWTREENLLLHTQEKTTYLQLLLKKRSNLLKWLLRNVL